MKQITLIFIWLFISACGVSIKSVVDNSYSKGPYKNTLIIIPYENNVTDNFATALKENLEHLFKSESRRVEIFLVEKKQDELKLNSNNEIDTKINESINNDYKDLIVIFRPTKLSFYNSGLQSATYIIVAIDAQSKKEIWKAEFDSSSSFGPTLFAKKSAVTIYEKLKTDNIL